MLGARGVSKGGRRVLRYTFFGADRLASIVNRVAKGFSGNNKGEYIKYQIKNIVAIMAATNLLQYLLTGNWTPDNEEGNELDLEIPFITDEKGNPMALNVGGTALESLRAINKPYRWITNKQGSAGRVLIITPDALFSGLKQNICLSLF
ncbi:MAG: hypothetical protein LBQ47_02800 [Endomicrobium sp.]|jgi:hypothetical protein|nr:hypothetical protein [Endomicrobium sp.]